MGKEIMFRSAIFAACVAAASAFAPLSSPLPNAVSGRVTATSGPSMQLFGEGKVQGKGVVAIPPLGRPDTPMFDGTWSGDVGFDPPYHLRLVLQRLVARGRAQALPRGDARHTRLHRSGRDEVPRCREGVLGRHQAYQAARCRCRAGHHGTDALLADRFEIFGTAAVIQMLQGSGRKPGDFGFDPLGFGKGKDISRLELAELKNGRLAMLAFSGIIHHYFITGKGPVELMTGA